ncbi:hypothetical protein HZA97_09230 [Candidatus Woesearchaeota archaeon]|nr:hypothetical protein [Candidatus Woesearchaeota archaeon]
MTIEDSLGKIKVDESKKPKEIPSQDFTSTNLEDDARKIMNAFLTKFFLGQVDGQKAQQSLSAISLDIIKNYGLDLFHILPATASSGSGAYGTGASNRKVLISNFNQKNFTDDLIKEMLVSICGEYSLQTDLVNLATKKEFEKLKTKVPEIRKIENELIGEASSTKYKLGETRSILHPLIIVMGMSLEYRSLATLAVQRGIDQKRLSGIKNLPDPLYISFFRTEREKFVPNAQDYVEVAKQYGLKEVIPTIDNFENSLANYETSWGT